LHPGASEPRNPRFLEQSGPQAPLFRICLGPDPRRAQKSDRRGILRVGHTVLSPDHGAALALQAEVRRVLPRLTRFSLRTSWKREGRSISRVLRLG